MFTALLLSVLAAGSPAVGTRVVQTDDPAVQLWISNDRRFYQSDRATVQIRARDDGYVIVLHADPDGHVRVLAPVDPNDDNFVRGGRKYDVKGRNGRESFTIEVSSGRGTVYAAYSAAPFRFEAYTPRRSLGLQGAGAEHSADEPRVGAQRHRTEHGHRQLRL